MPQKNLQEINKQLNISNQIIDNLIIPLSKKSDPDSIQTAIEKL
jgi:ribosomal protein S6